MRPAKTHFSCESLSASRTGQNKELAKEFCGRSTFYSRKRFLFLVRTKKRPKTAQKKRFWKDLSGKARWQAKRTMDARQKSANGQTKFVRYKGKLVDTLVGYVKLNRNFLNGAWSSRRRHNSFATLAGTHNPVLFPSRLPPFSSLSLLRGAPAITFHERTQRDVEIRIRFRTEIQYVHTSHDVNGII